MMNGREWSVSNINKTSDERTVLLESGQSLYQHKQMTKDVGREDGEDGIHAHYKI